MKNHLKSEDILNHWTGDGLRISPLDKNGYNMSSRSVKEHFAELSKVQKKNLIVDLFNSLLENHDTFSAAFTALTEQQTKNLKLFCEYCRKENIKAEWAIEEMQESL